MKVIRYALLVAIVALASSILVRSQDKTSTTGEPRTSTTANIPTNATKSVKEASSTKDANATIYFYRPKKTMGFALEPTVHCDERELARMDNGRYFGVTLAPGMHSFRMEDMKDGFEITMRAGQVYYAKVTIEKGWWRRYGKVTLIPPEQGAVEIKKVKPLDGDKVIELTMVTTFEGSPNQP